MLSSACRLVSRASPHLQKIIPAARCVHPWRSNVTLANTQRINVSLDEDTGICRLVLQNNPVNVMDKQMLTEMREIVTDADATSRFRAIIISSSCRGVYSAGLDIEQLMKAKDDEQEFRDYWNCLLDVMFGFYGMRPLTVAAIDGAALAGGCVLALACDYRIMTHGKHKIGLIEPQLSVDVPFWLCEMFRNQCGLGEAMRVLPYGRRYSVEEAYRIGLVEETCEPAELETRTMEFVNEAIKIPEEARYTTKLYLRHESLKKMRDGRDIDTDHKAALFQREDIQAYIQEYLSQVGKHKS